MLTVGGDAQVYYVVDSFTLARVGVLEMEHHDREVCVSCELPAHSACGLWRTFLLKSEVLSCCPNFPEAQEQRTELKLL